MHHDCVPPIVHRDISSRNILLDSEYEASISKFGTAKFLNPDSTIWTAVVGTYGYVAPVPSSSTSSSASKLPPHQMSIVDVLDQLILPPMHQEAGEVLSLVKIAFSCLNASLHSHPTMKKVSQLISTQKLHLSKPLHMITCSELLKPYFQVQKRP
ncbi:hypothetical protein DVH24_006764 [Malus domestica]|uniref:non-specific serine/threonine protein kinase n=1 Tax=Malus domestica TaxID=3750 RepID=A0A498J4V1_MALDO|nr:hypothetical protein DVH24_006764 [Malus domestica]